MDIKEGVWYVAIDEAMYPYIIKILEVNENKVLLEKYEKNGSQKSFSNSYGYTQAILNNYRVATFREYLPYKKKGI